VKSRSSATGKDLDFTTGEVIIITYRDHSHVSPNPGTNAAYAIVPWVVDVDKGLAQVIWKVVLHVGVRSVCRFGNGSARSTRGSARRVAGISQRKSVFIVRLTVICRRPFSKSVMTAAAEGAALSSYSHS
jgi:hypothetical protein